jgi:glutamine amidotransferase
MIAIVDYGLGNVGSVLNMLRKVGARGRITGAAAEIDAADRLILPGIGHFGPGMRKLQATGLVPVLEAFVASGRPVLGICLGMQMMTRGSDESDVPGLAWVAGFTHRFPQRADLRVPHMGWNRVLPAPGARLFAGEADDAQVVAPPPGEGRDGPGGEGALATRERFYFVHSYHVRMDDAAHVAATCRYGLEFTAAFQAGNLYGVQFHPEKSHHFGMALLRRFAAL